jgi:peptide/nickel transport system permease protein
MMRGGLTGLVARRLGAAGLLLLLVLSLLFALLQLAPGDPAERLLDPRIGSQQRQTLRAVYGLDRPPHVQYLRWLAATLRGDLGISFRHSRPVAEVLGDHLGPTLLLAAAAMVVQNVAGLLLGVTAARHAGRPADHLIRSGSVLLYSLPTFWLGLTALALLSYRLGLFPPGHMQSVGAGDMPPAARLLDLLHHLVLPALVLGLAAGGATARFVRNGLLDNLGEEFVRTARAKGLTRRRIVWLHALRNAATPLLQILGLSLPFLLSGALIVEVVFSWPGVGRLAFNSALARDYPVVLATTGLSGLLVIVGSLVADLLQLALDPRLRDES